jgi:hypothetical protein
VNTIAKTTASANNFFFNATLSSLSNLDHSKGHSFEKQKSEKQKSWFQVLGSAPGSRPPKARGPASLGRPVICGHSRACGPEPACPFKLAPPRLSTPARPNWGRRQNRVPVKPCPPPFHIHNREKQWIQRQKVTVNAP